MNNSSQIHSAKPEDIFTELPFGEQILLWGVRIWVNGHKNNSNIQTLLRSAYTYAGVPKAHAGLETMMEMITTAGCGVMEVRCPSCSKISYDEHRLTSRRPLRHIRLFFARKERKKSKQPSLLCLMPASCMIL